MSVRFDAAADFLSHATPPDLTAGVTITGWANRRVDTNDYATIASLFNGAGNQYYIAGLGSGGDTVICQQRDGVGGGTESSSALTISTGTWFAWAVVYNGTNLLTIYASTGTTQSQTLASADITAEDFYIGSLNGVEFFNGDITNVKLHTASLSQGDVESEWASEAVVIAANLWAYWPMDAAASAGTDASGNGRTLTVNGTLADGTDDPTFGGGGEAPFEEHLPPVALGQPWMQNTVIYG